MCPICQTESVPKIRSRATLGGDSQFDLVECPSCEVRFLSPLPTAAQLQQFYSPGYYGSDWYKQQGLGQAFLKVMLGNQQPGKFLDVGCGLGYFIDGIRQNSAWDVYGVEFAPEAAEFARKRLGLDVRQGNSQQLEFPSDFFDYIHIRNVLEHVTDPMRVLRECCRLLKPQGTLQLVVPNGPVDSLDLIRFYRGEGKLPFSKSGHLFFFSRQTLKWMIEQVGLKIERSRTYGLRRGLKSLGFWPHLKDWKKHYSSQPNGTHSGDITLPPRKNRPAIYYTYRLRTMNLRMLPGMYSFGLDYDLVLKRN